MIDEYRIPASVNFLAEAGCFFNDAATTEIYTLSLHDALPICSVVLTSPLGAGSAFPVSRAAPGVPDRKSTRLNSSHPSISYAVFCLKKKKDFNRVKNKRQITESITKAPNLIHVDLHILFIRTE